MFALFKVKIAFQVIFHLQKFTIVRPMQFSRQCLENLKLEIELPHIINIALTESFPITAKIVGLIMLQK